MDLDSTDSSHDADLFVWDEGERLDLEDVTIDMATLWMVLNNNDSLCMDDHNDRLALLKAAVKASPTGR